MVASENSETASRLGWLEGHHQLVAPAVGTGNGGHQYTCQGNTQKQKCLWRVDGVVWDQSHWRKGMKLSSAH